MVNKERQGNKSSGQSFQHFLTESIQAGHCIHTFRQFPKQWTRKQHSYQCAEQNLKKCGVEHDKLNEKAGSSDFVPPIIASAVSLKATNLEMDMVIGFYSRPL